MTVSLCVYMSRVGSYTDSRPGACYWCWGRYEGHLWSQYIPLAWGCCMDPTQHNEFDSFTPLILWSLNSNEKPQICFTWPFFMACRTRRSRPAACSSSVGIPETNMCARVRKRRLGEIIRRCHLWFMSHNFCWCAVAAGGRWMSPDRSRTWWIITSVRHHDPE